MSNMNRRHFLAGTGLAIGSVAVASHSRPPGFPSSIPASSVPWSRSSWYPALPPQWRAANEWDRPPLQIAQWALSHAIYPGLVFAKTDPIVQGHIALMQACTREDVPIETGWIPHEGVWNYNAAFVAHVYLWAGLPGWARGSTMPRPSACK